MGTKVYGQIMLSLDSAYPLAPAVVLPVLCGKVHKEPQCNVAVSECDRVEAPTLDPPLYIQLELAA